MNGCLPPGWSKPRLADVAELQLGKMLDRAKNVTGQSMPYLRNINVRWGAIETTDLYSMRFTNAEAARFSIRDGDVLVCEGGEPGRCAIWRGGPTDIKFQKAIHRIRPNAGVLPEWIALFLRHEALHDGLTDHLTGTTIKHLPAQALGALRPPVPPLAEQRRIVARIEALFARTRRARADLERSNVLAEHYRRSALATAFDKDACAKWPTVRFETIIREARIGLVRSKTEQHESTGRPYIRMQHYDLFGKWNKEHLTHVKTTEAEDASFELQAGDVLFNTRNSVELVGKVAVWPSGYEGFVYNNNLLRIRFKKGISPDFMRWVLAWSSFAGDLHAAKSATTSVAAIYQRDLMELSVPMPSETEQRSIASDLSAWIAAMDVVEREIARALALLDRLEQSILIHAFRGDLVAQETEPSAARTFEESPGSKADQRPTRTGRAAA